MTAEDKVLDSLSPLHPLLQREDTRRANRRRRKEGLDCSDSNLTLDTSGDVTVDSEEVTALKLTQLQNKIDTLQSSEKSLKRENSVLVERLAATKCHTREVSGGEELTSCLAELEKCRIEGKRMREELILSNSRNSYLETFVNQLNVSETRAKESDKELRVCQDRLVERERDILALKSREAEVTRLLSEADTDRRGLERLRELQSTLSHKSRTIDELREAKLNSDKKCRELEERNRLLKVELESAERDRSEKRGREDEVLQLTAELEKTRCEALTNEKRLKGLEKSKEGELNYLKDQINTKDQLIACKSMTVDGLKKEAESCKQEVKAMGVALEIKEFELEQLREFKLLVKSEREKMSGLKESLSDIQNEFEQVKQENTAKQESLLTQITDLKKSRKSLIKQLKQLEQLYTAKEHTHTSMEGEFSRLSQLFYALREKKIIPESKEFHEVLENIYKPSDSRTRDMSSLRNDSTADFAKPGLKRSLSAGSELKGILKKPNDFSPKCSTPNTSQLFSPNNAYTCSKHSKWLADREISDVL